MTNQLFQDVLDGRIPLPRRQIRPGFYFLTALADPTAPTMAELNAGIDISGYITIELPPQSGLTTVARERGREARNAAITKSAAEMGMHFEDMEAALMSMGAAAQRAAQAPQTRYVMPPPPYPVGNIATQKRRRKL